MNIIIQCAASKPPDAGQLRGRDNQQVMFVANPELAPQDGIWHARPDDLEHGKTWRQRLLEYNERVGNVQRLLPAYQLYSHPIYQDLVEKFGISQVFILSAGWGLIAADFLTPKYDITFSASAEKFKRRKPRNDFADFIQLPDSDDSLVFFGGKAYIPLLCDLTKNYSGQKYLPYNSITIPEAPGFSSVLFETTTRTNWHYECARAFLSGEFGLSLGQYVTC